MSEFFAKKPDHFELQLEVSTVFMEYNKKILLLRRSRCELSPNTWGIPGGKLEKGETPLEALSREISEELQLKPDPKELKFICACYVRRPNVNYRLHLFRWMLTSLPLIKLNAQEHSDYIWQPLEKFGDLPLLEGQLEAFQFVYKNCKV
jgi:8-oxo-dGTP pyrophosphatase MutT (NUDIX family)